MIAGVDGSIPICEEQKPMTTEQMLPLVYDALRRLAANRLASEPPGQTLAPTALVHEVYLRLGGSHDPRWNSRSHFFAAAALAMRRILIENARRKRKERGWRKIDLNCADIGVDPAIEELLFMDEAITHLAVEDPKAAELVRLRYFSGLSVEEAADILQIPRATAYRHWKYAEVWIHAERNRDGRGSSDAERRDSAPS